MLGNGGDFNVTTGLGSGAGNKAGNITLNPGATNNGADAGKVVLHKEVQLNDYTTNGLLTTSGGTGLIDTPIQFSRGRITVVIPIGNNQAFSETITDSAITATSIFTATLELDPGMTKDHALHLENRDSLTNTIEAHFELSNATGGALNAYINYFIINP